MKYFIRNLELEKVKVKAEPITVPGLEQFNLIIHDSLRFDGLYFMDNDHVTISHVETGSMVSTGISKQWCLKDIQKRLKKKGIEVFIQAIEKMEMEIKEREKV